MIDSHSNQISFEYFSTDSSLSSYLFLSKISEKVQDQSAKELAYLNDINLWWKQISLKNYSKFDYLIQIPSSRKIAQELIFNTTNCFQYDKKIQLAKLDDTLKSGNNSNFDIELKYANNIKIDSKNILIIDDVCHIGSTIISAISEYSNCNILVVTMFNLSDFKIYND